MAMATKRFRSTVARELLESNAAEFDDRESAQNVAQNVLLLPLQVVDLQRLAVIDSVARVTGCFKSEQYSCLVFVRYHAQ